MKSKLKFIVENGNSENERHAILTPQTIVQISAQDAELKMQQRQQEQEQKYHGKHTIEYKTERYNNEKI